ncbi:MAG TPA: TraB/GumN family protein, partial [Rhodothermales bacterium]|nr:TraB/GumN family protein [Rhodothermales bacterium]
VLAPPARAQLLYRAERDGRVVHLLGSVHLLPRDAHALGPAVEVAYRASDAVVFELSPDAMMQAASALLRKGMLPPDSTLAALLPDTSRVRLEPYLAGPYGAVLRRARPWLAALLVQQLALAEVGYDAASGVEGQLFARAHADARLTHAFETVEDQMGLLSGIPLEDQLAALAHALSDPSSARLDRLVALWRAGDAEALAAEVAAEFAATPAHRERLLDARNRAWLPRLEARAAVTPTLLVVVGAGHLVGETGLVALLRGRGWTVSQVPAR